MAKLQADLRPAWRNYWAAYVVVAFLILSALGGDPEGANEGGEGLLWTAAIVILGFVILKRYSWRFIIDGDKVRRHFRLISRNQQGVRIEDLRSVEYNQGVVQRLLGIGNVAFYTAGSGSSEVTFHGVKDPAGWRDAIDREIDAGRASTKRE